jgi:hypothetical protein
LPKNSVRSDTPIWYELVAELGDPRPYQPTQIDEIVVDPNPCVTQGAWDSAIKSINTGARDAARAFDKIYRSERATP